MLTLAPVLLPKYQAYLPSAAAFGLSWVFHWYYGLLFFLGALVALLLEKRKPKLAEEFTFPVASGVVAGGSLMGVVLVLWATGAAFSASSSAIDATGTALLMPLFAAGRRNDVLRVKSLPSRCRPMSAVPPIATFQGMGPK